MKHDLFVAVLIQEGNLGDTLISPDVVEVFEEALNWYKKNKNGLVVIEKGMQGSVAKNERFFTFDVKEKMEVLLHRIYNRVIEYKVEMEKGENITL